jgi:hypothetical protein
MMTTKLQDLQITKNMEDYLTWKNRKHGRLPDLEK